MCKTPFVKWLVKPIDLLLSSSFTELSDQIQKAMQLEEERRRAEKEAERLEAERLAALQAKEELEKQTVDQMKSQEQLVGTIGFLSLSI